MKDTELTQFFKDTIARPYDDKYGVGVQFFFNLRNLERLAGKHCIVDNRSPETNAINRNGGFNTVPDFDFPEFEEYLWEKIRPTLEQNNVTFISTCLALTYKPKYHKVNMHIHREGLRPVNPSPYNYTFFICNDDEATVNFDVIDHATPYEDIINYKLVDYVSVDNLRNYIKDKPLVRYELHTGDVMRFNATQPPHAANENFTDDETIGAYLVLNGCMDTLSPALHQTFKRA